MQQLLDIPRQSLSPDTVTGLLQSFQNVQVSYGARHLDATLSVIGDLTEFMSEGSSIASDVTASPHRTCTLMLDSTNPVNYGTEFVQPYMVLTNPNTGESATFYLGVYTLSTPAYDNSNLPSVLTVTGWDLLYYMNAVIGDSVQITAGTDPVTAAITLIGEAFPGANINYVDTTSVLAAPVTFPFDENDSATDYLTVINTLLATCGYQPLWVDWSGTFQLLPYVTPTSTDAEWSFDLTDADNIVAEQRESEQDLFDVPNYWLFVMTNLTTPPVEGVSQLTYIDASPTNPGSFVNRGRYLKKILYVTAADFPSLQAFGLSVVAADLRPVETFTVTTSPFPLAWHYDQIAMRDPNLVSIPPTFAQTRRVQSMSWTLPLDGQSDMEWTWQTVYT